MARILSIAAVAVLFAQAHAQAGRILNEGDNLVLFPPSEAGTIVFHDASAAGGMTSIKAMTASISSVAANAANAIEASKIAVTAQLAQADKDLAAGLGAAEEKTNLAIAGLEDTVAASEAKLQTNIDATKASITTVVKPQIDAVTASLSALETKIKKDIDDDIKVELEMYKNALKGTDANVPAENCAAVKAARPGEEAGLKWIKNGNSIVQVWCADGKSLGGSGATQAEAASDCFSNPLAEAYGLTSLTKFVDPDADANDTGNAKTVTCPGNGLTKAMSAKTCKEIKKNFETAKNGVYWLHGRNDDFKSAPFQAYCWLADRDGGGWTLFLRSYYRDGGQPRFDDNNRGSGSTGDVNDKDTMHNVLGFSKSSKFENYKLDDKYIRAVIGQANPTNGARTSAGKNMFSYMVDQSGYNDHYSYGNYEYGIMKKYTARWRFVRWEQMDSSSTPEEFTSYKIPNFDGHTPVGDGDWNWKGRPKCGKNYVGSRGGAGISCNNAHNGSPDRRPLGGRNCRTNVSRDRWHGDFHLYMLNTNHDTYFRVCNGHQHSSWRRFAHRWWIRTHDGDTVA